VRRVVLSDRRLSDGQPRSRSPAMGSPFGSRTGIKRVLSNRSTSARLAAAAAGSARVRVTRARARSRPDRED
jgi:hypothetical protein